MSSFFKGIKKQYGEPKALVHDMGKGILNAVAEVFPGTPDFICHFHFLRDIGKDLLNNDYIALQKRLRKLKIRPTLRRRAKYLEQKINPDCHDIGEIIWIFDYPNESDGYGFPFDHAQVAYNTGRFFRLTGRCS